MEDEALIDSYKLFKDTGYKGTIESYKTLVSTNPDALNDAHKLFVDTGYNGDLNSFSSLIGIKKKSQENVKSTSTNQELVSQASTTDSSSVISQAGQKSSASSKLGTILSPSQSGVTTDTNLAKGQLVKDGAVLTEKPNKFKPEDKSDGFGNELYRSIKRGSERMGRDIAAIPEFIYDVFAIPQNVVAETFGIGGLSADSESFKENLSIKNPVKDFYAEKVKQTTAEKEIFDKKYTGGIVDNIQQGNYVDSFRILTSSIAESLPTTLSIALSGGALSTPSLLVATTGTFGAGKNEDLKESDSGLSNSMQTINALGTGFSEGVFSTIGTGTIGVAGKEILKKEGVKEGSVIFKNGLIETYKSLLKKYSIPTAMVGEGIEEAATQITQNAISIHSGEAPDLNIMEGVADAFLIGVGSGGGFGIALEGIKKATSDNSTKDAVQILNDSKLDSKQVKIELAQQVIEGSISKEEAKTTYDNFEEIQNQLRAVPEDLSVEQKSQAVDILKERTKLEQEISGKDPSLVVAKKAKIEELNNQLKSIAETPTNQGVEDTLSPTVELNPTNTKSAYDFDDTLFDNKSQQLTDLGKEVQSKVANGEDVTIISAREDTPQNRQFIADKLGIPANKIKLVGKEDQNTKKAQILDELGIPKDDFVEADQSKKEGVVNNTDFDPLESEGEAIGRLASTITTEDKTQKDQQIDAIAEQHTQSYLDYLEEQGVEESVLKSDFVNTFKERLVKALNNPSKFDFNQPRARENGSRIDKDGNKMTEAEFLVQQGSIKPQMVSEVLENTPNNTTTIEENTNQQPQTISEPEGQTAQETDVVETQELTKDQKKQNALVDRRNEYNRLSDSRKRSQKGRELKRNVTELAKDLGFKVSESSNKLTVTNDLGKSVGKIAFKEQLPPSKPSDIDYALQEIDRGVLLWNNDPSSPRIDLEMTRADIVKGEADLLKGNNNTVPAKRLVEALRQAKERGNYEYIQGSGKQIERLSVPLAERIDYDTELNEQELERLNTETDALSNQYEEWFNKQSTETQTEIYGNQATDSEVAKKPAERRKGKKNVTDTTQSKQERKKIANAKIDEIADWLKASLPSAKFNTDDINANGITQDQLINLIASSAKSLVSATIDIDTAIKQVVDALKQKFDFDVDIDKVKERMNPKQPKNAPNDFQRKQGVKSLFARIYEGETNEDILDVIEANGLNYKIENQEKAQDAARKFVQKVGIDNALKALDDNLIKGAERTFVYAEILDRLKQASEGASIEQIGKVQNDYSTTLDKALVAFEDEVRNAGRFIGALNRVFLTSDTQYSLTKQVADYKAKNNGVIDEETLTKFKEADKKIKELETKIKALEEENLKKQGNQAIQNIKQANTRNPNPKKPSRTARSQAKKIADNVRKAKIHRPNIFSSATPATLVWDGAVELTAKSIEAGGTIADAIKQGVAYIKKSDWYKSLSKSDQDEAINAFNNSIVDSSANNVVTLSYDGKIQIPQSLINELVANGIEDIDELSSAILEIIKQDDPNTRLTIREVRDAITKYGKTINPTQDQLKAKIAEMKGVGRLLSALEDVIGGDRPKKSGLQRRKPTQTERELKSLIEDKMKDLPVDDADLDVAWRNALDKIKSRIKNRIEDVQKQIDSKQRTTLQKKPTKLDAETIALKQQLETLNEELDNLVGKKELTDQQKINRTVTALENAITKLTDQIADGNLEYRETQNTITNAKIEQLKQAKKALSDELLKLRKDAGIVEKRRIESAKKRVNKQIEEYKRRLREKDFSKPERNPIKEDNELRDLIAEKIKWQEVYDKESYQLELKNRTNAQKFKDLAIGILNIPRILMAGGEMSMVLIQGGVQTISLLTRNPKALARTFGKAFLAVGSQRKSDEYTSRLKTNPYYDTMKKFKLGLTEADYKMELREEEFIGNNLVYGLWNMIGKGLEYGSVKVFGVKDVASVGSTLLSVIKSDIKKEKLPISERFKNMNPLLAFERGNTIYMNEIRSMRYLDGMKMIEMEGKNENDNPEDYRKLARAINTLTGRAELNWKIGDKATNLESINDILNTIFFSFKNTVSVFNQLNPVWYVMQHSPNDPIYKPSVAQKIAVRDMLTFVSTTTASMLLLQAFAGSDDDDEPIIKIETDPRSSDFMQMKIKGKNNDVRFDPWHGMKPQVVFLAKLFDGNTKNSKGKIERIGKGYNADTQWDNLMRTYVENKFSPSMGIVYRYLDSEVKTVNGEEMRVRYGQPIMETMKENLYPMYINSIIEIEGEDPNLVVRYLEALSFFGINSSVYGSKKSSGSTSEAIDPNDLPIYNPSNTPTNNLPIFNSSKIPIKEK